jgi:C3 family ADP-ribosyltransferase
MSLTQSEKRAVSDYQDGYYSDFNRLLREKGGLGKISEHNELLPKIKSLKAALNHASLPQAVVAHRGISYDSLSKLAGVVVEEPAYNQYTEDWAKSVARKLETTIGKVARDHGFVSTSLYEKSSFAHQTATKARIELDVPKGAKAAYIDAATNDMASETELLLQHGTKFKITRIDVEEVEVDIGYEATKFRPVVYATVLKSSWSGKSTDAVSVTDAAPESESVHVPPEQESKAERAQRFTWEADDFEVVDNEPEEAEEGDIE